MTTPTPTPTDRVLILGCGCFGVSTAYHLLTRGYTNITILDRSPVVPAPDAASNDINRIVRSGYPDKFYSELCRDAISLWKDEELYGNAYQESGCIIVLNSPGSSSGIPTEVAESYGHGSYANDLALGARVSLLETGAALRSVFPPSLQAGSFQGKSGYLNKDGGWADAGKGLKKLIDRVLQLGAKIETGKDVKELIRGDGRQTKGVKCADGSTYEADLVVIAMGSWTPSAFSDLNGSCLATGQCVAMIQLTPEEAAPYKETPVFLDFNTGFYVFPANAQNIVKMAIHCVGYTVTDADTNISTPRTVTSNPTDGLAIPKPDLAQLRDQLRQVYPELAKKPFASTRLCWYNDSPDGDWVISRVPGDAGLVLATAGSGHAYKFLPIIGRIAADLIQDKLPQDLVAKFAVNRPHSKADLSREGLTQELPIDQLCTKEDLKAPTSSS
ncbi:FAD dependent oxidoreductase [Ephemerocybe angulata]|uniref:FAD dependent oxidoreductase n=1 Tax=Ephemerocybe angulata TaxID=980116 RepID=A0A8H6I9A3_9AGAR|nr:FAD dependent oxidoreductase [Tulosesus angulatus]